MSTEYPHGGGRYLGQWGSVSLIYISRVSSVSSPLSGGTPHTSKSTKKCIYRPGGPSGWGLDGQVSCQGHPLGVGTSPPHVSWAYPSIFSRKGPMLRTRHRPKIGQNCSIPAPIANVDQLWSARDSPDVFPGPHAGWGWSRGPIQVQRPAYVPITDSHPGPVRRRCSCDFTEKPEKLPNANLLGLQCCCMGWVLVPTGHPPQCR